MELFTSGDESQIEVIKQWIGESDIFLLILGGRYGSIESKTDKSYIQLEYEYAIEKKKPLFACVINEGALENRVKSFGSKIIETMNAKKLNEFRALVLSKLVKFWDDTKDIKLAIMETLSCFMRDESLSGWVRANQKCFAGAAWVFFRKPASKYEVINDRDGSSFTYACKKNERVFLFGL